MESVGASSGGRSGYGFLTEEVSGLDLGTDWKKIPVDEQLMNEPYYLPSQVEQLEKGAGGPRFPPRPHPGTLPPLYMGIVFLLP